MITPTAAWRTAVRTTTVAALTAGVLIMGVASAHAAGTLAPLPDSGLLGSLGTTLNGLLSGVLSGGAINTILPTGILGGTGG
jgi:hypothetical protein